MVHIFLQNHLISCFVCFYGGILLLVNCELNSEVPLSLADHFKTTFISRDGWKLLLIPSPCNCQADIFLMGLHSTITRTPLLNEKPVTKWRRRTLADPILRDWHCLAKKCVSLRVVFKNSAVFANKLGHTRVHLTAVWTPHS